MCVSVYFKVNAFFLCLQVIPEVDMPGHGHAAIKAMESRRKRLLAANNQSEANRCAGKTTAKEITNEV